MMAMTCYKKKKLMAEEEECREEKILGWLKTGGQFRTKGSSCDASPLDIRFQVALGTFENLKTYVDMEKVVKWDTDPIQALHQGWLDDNERTEEVLWRGVKLMWYEYIAYYYTDIVRGYKPV